MEQRHLSPRNESATASLDVSDSAQQFGFGDGRIFVRDRIPFCNPKGAILNFSFFYQPVNEETVVARNQNHLSRS
jgi:hypothetical protein